MVMRKKHPKNTGHNVFRRDKAERIFFARKLILIQNWRGRSVHKSVQSRKVRGGCLLQIKIKLAKKMS